MKVGGEIMILTHNVNYKEKAQYGITEMGWFCLDSGMNTGSQICISCWLWHCFD